ncbi:homeobox protein NOBOX [Tenrec ecaudatus]|uniref:homeobox protein NOBOX n=1 Tax=Tenrec ecaudatus TaxID=94439 RepID=UPI003F598CBB
MVMRVRPFLGAIAPANSATVERHIVWATALSRCPPVNHLLGHPSRRDGYPAAKALAKGLLAAGGWQDGQDTGIRTLSAGPKAELQAQGTPAERMPPKTSRGTPGAGRPLQGREAKPGRPPSSLAPAQQKRLKAKVGEAVAAPCGPPSNPALHHPVPCELGRGPCHLANLLSTLAPGSPGSSQKQGPPEGPCQPRKKSRTLYRSDQLEELEKAFQEDHYPDSDRRREISQTVGVAPQRIMVWFQNRRAKWRRVEKVTRKGDSKSPVALAPAEGQASSGPAEPRPVAFRSPGPGTNHEEPPLGAPPGPGGLSEGTHRVAVTPPLFSPPPVRRPGLPFPLGPMPTPQLMPLLLEEPPSDGGSRDGPCVSWGSSITPPPTCSFSEGLEPQDRHPAPQQDPLSFLGPPQPLFSCLNPFPFPVPSSGTPPTLEDTFFSGPFGLPGGPSQGYFPGPPSGQVLLQPPAGSMGPLSWSHPYLPELPLPSPFCTQALGPPSGMESFFQEDLFPSPYDQAATRQPSPGPTMPPMGARPLGTGPVLSRVPDVPPTAPPDHPAARDKARGEDKSSLAP